jgi:hypothetical protein
MGGLALAGCAEQRTPISAADAVALVQSGRALLSCREACLAAWQSAQPQAARLDAARRWPELGALVLQVGYEDDLSLYYLGRVAEGIGFPGAAASYYRQSTRFSGTANACASLSRLCGGVALPRAAWLRLAAIDQRLSPPPRRRTAPGRAEPAVPAPNEPEISPAETVEAPPPPAPVPIAPASPAVLPAPAAPTPPVRGGPAAHEFIEPPPAAR